MRTVAKTSVIPVHDLFEVHLTVANLNRAIAFYRDAVGLRLAHIESSRQVAFFWIGSVGNAMLGLWSAGERPQTVTSHTAFSASLVDVLAAPDALRAAGITPLDFEGRPTDHPIVFAWMPAVSVFFRDPDGNLLEYIARLPEEPRPEYGIMPWRMWEQMHQSIPFHV
jgi:lactoylglutathione lyase